MTDKKLEETIDTLWCDSWVHKSTRSWYAEERMELEEEYKKKTKKIIKDLLNQERNKVLDQIDFIAKAGQAAVGKDATIKLSTLRDTIEELRVDNTTDV